MIDITKDVQSLTTFRRNSAVFLKQIKKTKRPVVLTVKGKAQAVVRIRKSTSACSILQPMPISMKPFDRPRRISGREESGTSRNSSRNSKPSMAYRVKITLRAERDMAGIEERIGARFSNAAGTWYVGLRNAIRTLRDNPTAARPPRRILN